MVKLHIYLFRHGETFFNRKHEFTGWKDARLTEKGKKNARKVARKLKGKHIDVGYYSGLKRCGDTLKEVLKQHPECQEIIVDPRIKERSYGTLSGKTHKKFVEEQGTEDYHALLHNHLVNRLRGKELKEFVKAVGEAELKIVRRSYRIAPPGGESIRDVRVRVESFIKDLKKKMRKEKIHVAICAHGNSMRPFRKYFEKLSIEEMMQLENPWDDYFEYVLDVK